MKNIFILLLTIILSAQIFPQEQTLLGDGEVSHGGYGGPVIKFSQVNDNFAVLFGGRGGWIINHTFVIGGAGYGLVNSIDGNEVIFGSTRRLDFGYGGLELGYINKSDDLIHFSVYTLIGAGSVRSRVDDDLFPDYDDNHDTFFVLEPSLNVVLNLTTFMRVAVGGSYRYVNVDKVQNLTSSDLSGPSIGLTLKFGKF
ncbi:MAG: hypothetical protein IPM56_14085 [Ignavibacteriales bacterium]|nr:MAG: hypothetical protein IPM56_14085 [Ignavibacteriales bacterium]